MEISNDTLELIISEKFSEDFWFFELGRAQQIQENSIGVDHQFMSSFFDNGKKLWEEYLDKLQNVICDKVSREPKEFVKEITSGNIKDLAANVITVLASTYSMTLAISIPLVALALKKGIANVCK